MALLKVYNTLSFFILFICMSVVSSAQSGEPIILKYADSLIGRDTLSSVQRELIGNVRLQQGNVHVWCDRAIQYLSENRAELIGNVKIVQGTVTMTGPRADYDGNQKIAYGTQGVTIVDRKTTLKAEQGIYSMKTNVADFFNNVRLEDDTVIIESDTARYERKTRNSFAQGNVILSGKTTNAILAGDSAFHYPDKEYSLVKGKAFLLKVDTINLDTTNNELKTKDTSSITSARFRLDSSMIISEWMESFRDKQDLYIAHDSVEILRGSLFAKASKAFFDNMKEMIILQSLPVVWTDSTQILADSIVIQMDKKKLREIRGYKNAFSTSKDDTNHTNRINQLSGDFLHVIVNEDSIRQIFSKGDAKSLYFMLTDNEPDGAARNSADSIRINIIKNKPEQIYWLGAVVGDVYPESVLFAKENEYSLPNYRRMENKPKKMKMLERLFTRKRVKKDSIIDSETQN